MRIRSWFRFRRSKGQADERSLLREQHDDPKLRRIQQAAAEDVAAVREDDKYFDPDSPGNRGL